MQCSSEQGVPEDVDVANARDVTKERELVVTSRDWKTRVPQTFLGYLRDLTSGHVAGIDTLVVHIHNKDIIHTLQILDIAPCSWKFIKP